LSISALVLHKNDNVATAVRPLPSGDKVTVEIGNSVADVALLRPVPFGHKFALRDIKAGERIIKYGETIGQATEDIKKGEHVHLHNVEGLRGRGDRP
jgi:altronate dehydratase small subunit